MILFKFRNDTCRELERKKSTKPSEFTDDLCPQCKRRLVRKYSGKQVTIPSSLLETRNYYLYLAYLSGRETGKFKSLHDFGEYARGIARNYELYLLKTSHEQPKMISKDRIVREIQAIIKELTPTDTASDNNR